MSAYKYGSVSKEGMATPQDKQGSIHLLTMSTPNGQAAQIALEELKDAYNGKPDFTADYVPIGTNWQKEDWFLKHGKNGRIPVIIDHTKNDYAVQETGAILLYLNRFYDPEHKFGYSLDSIEQSEMEQWMFFKHGGIGPMQGQFNHFNLYAPEKIPYGIKRYHDETLRLYSVLEDNLKGRFDKPRQYLTGDKYTYADMTTFPWVNVYERSGLTKEEMNEFPNVLAWLERIKSRTAVRRGLENYNEPEKKE